MTVGWFKCILILMPGEIKILDDTGQRVRLLRLLFTATRKHMAQNAGVSLTVLNNIEQNKYSTSELYKRTIQVLVKVAQSIGANPDWVVRATPPVFSRKLAFISLNLERSKGPVKFEKELTSASFVRQVASYLVESEGVQRAWVFTRGGEAFFGLESSRPSCTVLFTDRLVKKSIIPLLLEKNVPLFVEDSDVSGVYGMRAEAAVAITDCLRAFYQGPADRGMVAKLQRATNRFVEKVAEKDDIIIAFSWFLEDVTDDDVASPFSIGRQVKAERIARFIRDIAASSDDVKAALELLHYH